ncbi:MAG: tyrosine-type recombinase/integrase [Pseudomonadota bacterium]
MNEVVLFGGDSGGLVGQGSGLSVPALVAAAGEVASRHFLDFFTSNIRNPNTRAAYARGIGHFLAWCEAGGLAELSQVQSVHVAAYIEGVGRELSAPTVKQRLAAIRMLFDWLVVRQVVPSNPASSVRGPKHVVTKGKTPVIDPEEARLLLDSIPLTTITGLRDRALIGLMIYSFARISAAVAMNVEDVFWQKGRRWVRLHEKGGKHHTMPAHHNLQDYLEEYLAAAGIVDDPKGPLFRTARGRSQVLQPNRLLRSNAWDIVQRRARQAGIQTNITNHTFRATGITAYLKNGGKLEHAQAMAAHSSTRTTQLYDRRGDEISLDEVERILI